MLTFIFILLNIISEDSEDSYSLLALHDLKGSINTFYTIQYILETKVEIHKKIQNEEFGFVNVINFKENKLQKG